VDGFLKSHTIDLALIVASDADPGRGLAEHFPFSPVGAAALCRWSVDDCGLGNIHWLNIPDEGESFSATVGLIDGHNVLRFRKSAAMDQQFALASAKVTDRCLRHDSPPVRPCTASLSLSDSPAPR
jgi:3-oxoacyl-[acyl-carrier-protein] synthase III